MENFKIPCTLENKFIIRLTESWDYLTVTRECFREKSTIQLLWKFMIHLYVKKLTKPLLCLKLINYGLVWIFIGKVHIKLLNAMDFTCVELSL